MRSIKNIVKITNLLTAISNSASVCNRRRNRVICAWPQLFSDFLPFGCHMTALALPAESRIVYVVLCVATGAGTADIGPANNRGFMASVTIDFLVCAIKLIAGLGMVKIPGFPGPCVMANFTSGTEAALVNIILVVAGRAC